MKTNENRDVLDKTSLRIDKFKRPYAKTSLMITIMLTSVSLNVVFPKRPYACFFFVIVQVLIEKRHCACTPISHVEIQ